MYQNTKDSICYRTRDNKFNKIITKLKKILKVLSTQESQLMKLRVTMSNTNSSHASMVTFSTKEMTLITA